MFIIAYQKLNNFFVDDNFFFNNLIFFFLIINKINLFNLFFLKKIINIIFSYKNNVKKKYNYNSKKVNIFNQKRIFNYINLNSFYEF